MAALFAVVALAPLGVTGAQVHLPLGPFGSANQPAFVEATAVAIDQASGDVLVADLAAQTLSRFHEDGTPADFSALGANVIDGHAGGEDATPQGEILARASPSQVPIIPNEVQIAVDSSGGVTDGDIYLTDSRHRVIDVFSSAGKYLGQVSESLEGPLGVACGVAVDQNGTLYVGDFKGKIHKYLPSANPPLTADNVANFSMTRPCTMAAGAGASAGALFATEYVSASEGGLGHVFKLDATTGAVLYEVTADQTTTIGIDPGTGRLFTATGKAVREYDVSGAAKASLFSTLPFETEAFGVAANETTGNVYVSLRGEAMLEEFTGLITLPLASTEAATGVGGGQAVLRGAISADGGPPAGCAFEYVEASAKGFEGAASVPCSPAGPFTGTTTSAVSAALSGLGEATYRFRLVASNENGNSFGQALLLSTESANGLPDGRAYEMVSPPAKAGEVIPPEAKGILNGSCLECLPGGDVAKMPMQASAAGDAVAFEGQAFGGGFAAGPNQYLAARSAGGWASASKSLPQYLSFIAFEEQGQGFLAFSGDLSRAVIMQVEPSLSPLAPPNFANLYRWEQGAALVPVVRSEPPQRLPGFGGGLADDRFIVVYAGANAGTPLSPAFGHLVLEANDALSEASAFAPAAPEVSATERNLYESVGEELRLVNVLPDGSAAPDAVIGSGRLLLTHPQNEGPDFDRAISADGSRIFWSRKSDGQVFVRLNGEQTREIPDHVGKYLTAAADGSEVLLTNGRVYGDLEAEPPAEAADLTQGLGGFEGILGSSEDLSRVYFVDSEVLTGGEENANEEAAEPGAHNLYAWHQEGETATTQFIGRLLGTDNEPGGALSRVGDWHPQPAYRTAQVTPNGLHLAFMSGARLTGYDNNQANGEGCRSGAKVDTECSQVFEYEAETGGLSCASCNPSGEAPLGKSNLSLIDNESPTTFFPQPHNLTANGRLFFESQDALSPHDTNGHIQDVYEWEPSGVGSCTRARGCVSLISSGHSPNDSQFLDATPSGDDAFFITREQLLPQDKDEYLDLYDARVAGGLPTAGTAPCGGEACRGAAAAAPAVPSAASTGASAGNPKAPAKCKKGYVKKNGRCVRKPSKHKKKPHKHSRRTAGKDRGGAR
jgi:outer membrane protein assembly factor BamB